LTKPLAAPGAGEFMRNRIGQVEPPNRTADSKPESRLVLDFLAFFTQFVPARMWAEFGTPGT